MRSTFANHFSNDESTKQQLWDDCVFVFDTNVLTSLYKRSDEAREALLKIIESLGERVWIPHQVAYEFLRNRPTVAHDQSVMYMEAIKKLSAFLADLESNTKHPFVSTDLHSEFVEVSGKVVSVLEEKVAYYESKIVSDDLKERLADLLEGKVGEGYDDAKLREKIKVGESRYANHVPPGYEDATKHKNSQVFEHVRARYGDLILWFQVLEYAKVGPVSVILVTGDQKDDWWLRVGGKTIGPRPELLEEFKAQTGADFFMYSHSSFLSLANDYLHQRTSQSVIKEIEDAALELEVDAIPLPWNEPEALDLGSLLENERVLKAEFESASQGFARLMSKLANASSPAETKKLRSELNQKLAIRERLRKQLLSCISNIQAVRALEFDDLV